MLKIFALCLMYSPCDTVPCSASIYSGTFPVPPAAAGKREGSEDTSRSGQGTASPGTPCRSPPSTVHTISEGTMTSVAKKALPKVDGDFYHISATVSEEDQALLHRVRTFMETEVAPIINEYWIREEFPHQLISGLAALGIAGQAYRGYGCPGKSAVLDGLVAVEMARVDSSIATFFGVHSGLAMGSIYLCGSGEQKQQWL